MEIYEYVREMRMKRGATMKQLYDGLCSQSTAKMFEVGERKVNVYFLFRILERLEIGEGHLQFLMKEQDYKLWLKRAEILDAMRIERYDDALEKVLKWEKELGKTAKAEKQFVHRMKAICMIHTGCKDESIQNEVAKALRETVPDFEEKWSSKLMSVHELDMLLDYYHYSNSNQTESIRDVVVYMKNRKALCGKRNILLGKGVVYYANSLFRDEKVDQLNDFQLEELKIMIDEALDVLRTYGRYYYLLEILEYRKKVICLLLTKNPQNIGLNLELEETEKWKNALLKLYDSIGIRADAKEMLSLYTLSYVELINSVVERRRNIFKLSEKRLAGNKCDPRTVKRIEQEGMNPQTSTMELLLKGMGLPGIWGKKFFLPTNIDIMEQMVQLDQCFRERKYDAVLAIIACIENEIDGSDVYSNQNLEWYKIESEKFSKKITAHEAVQRLKKNLDRSIAWESIMRYGMDYLSLNEAEHMTAILLHMDKSDIEFKKLIYRVEEYCGKYLGDYKVINYSTMISVSLNILQARLAELDEFEKANQLIEEMMPSIVFNGDLLRMMDAAYDYWWNENELNGAGEQNRPDYLVHIAELIKDTSSVSFFEKKFNS